MSDHSTLPASSPSPTPASPAAPPFTTAERFRTLFTPPILALLPIYCGGLIPFASLLAWLSSRLDARLGIPSLHQWLAPDSARLVFVLCLAVGAAIVGWSYTYLVLEGGGGPVPPFSAKTCNLVTNGPYAYMRHPSIWGKLIGVVGLGVYFGSPTFLALTIPALLYWSLNHNMEGQDADMRALFGEPYIRYAAQTPRLIPRLRHPRA